MLSDPHLRRDLLKLLYLLGAVAGTVALFVSTPTLSTPTLLSIVITLMLSPIVASLERRGKSRSASIGLVFGALGIICTALGWWAFSAGTDQWSSFRQKAPEYFTLAIGRMTEHENHLKEKFPVLSNSRITESVVQWGEKTGKWFAVNGPRLVGDLLAWMLLVPFLTWVMLSEGRRLRKKFFELVPNRFFEITFLVTSKIGTGLSDYIRAKLVEALMVGAMTTVGLSMIGAPYAFVLGIVAGVTNILPYLGPLMGAMPGILVATLDPSKTALLMPICMVYLIVNVIDMVVIFPIIVAKLVNLHPLILIAVVVMGQKYYGLVGMLISIPVATAFKVVLQEIYSAVYLRRTVSRISGRLIA